MDLKSEDIPQLTAKSLLSLIEATRTLNGSAGALNSLRLLSDRILGNETSSSLDSELSLLWLLPGGSPISGRLLNPFMLESEKLQKNLTYPFLMVSRIDASTPAIVKANIRAAISTEKNGGINGKVLIDSRGFGFDKRDEFGTWDRKLVNLGKKSFGNNLTVEFDNNPELAEATDDIGMYVGWYQLRTYQDSYTFSKGAIGYHIASEEALNIHNPDEKGWCKNLLDRGIVATSGAIEEPYLDSFIDPDIFFPLITTGKYTLVDAYYLSTKYISWRQILFGDPLYRPFSSSKNSTDIDDLDFPPPQAPSTILKTADYYLNAN